MTPEELFETLNTLGIPVVYDHFEQGEAPELPYMVYRYPGSNNFIADGMVYLKVNEVDIELYTSKKTPKTEEKVEELLAKIELVYNKKESYIETEKMYEVLYETEV